MSSEAQWRPSIHKSITLKTMVHVKLLVHSAAQVIQISNQKATVIRGADMQNIDIFSANGDDGVSVAVDSSGHILAIDYDSVLLLKYPPEECDRVIDAHRCSVIPGLVDAHTHPVWAGDRVHEFAMKLAGASYMDIHQAGGGIHFTVEHTRRTSEEDLLSSLKTRLWSMLKAGTTLVECKSGYGLDVETELKLLRVIDKARKEMPIDISCTYLAAHAVPRDQTAVEATNEIVLEHIPKIEAVMKSKAIRVDQIDVFCEQGVFDVEQSRTILKAGQKIGLSVNLHGDELHPLGSAEMAASIGAKAISHLEEISENGISALAKSGTIAVVLPTTAYILKLRSPPVRKMIDQNVSLALGSDFNPNAYCLSMPLVMHLACVNFNLTLTEALVAATLNAAASLDKGSSHGSLEPGKVANMVVINEERWEHLIYRLGCHESPIKHVIVRGNVVIDNTE